MFEKTCLLDPGSCTFRLYGQNGALLASCRSVMAKSGDHIVAGDKALSLYEQGKTRSLIYPIDQGVMNQSVQPLFAELFEQYPRTKFLLKPSLCVLVPYDIKEKDKDRWVKEGLKAGFRKVTFLRDLDLIEEDDTLMIHAGHSRVTIAFYRKHKPVFMQSMLYGGRMMDQAIETGIVHRLKGLMYEENSHELKEKVSEALWEQKNDSFELRLLDSRKGLVRKSVTAAQVWPMMEDSIMQVVYWTKNILDNLPSDIQKSIEENGIVLSGGLANCYGLAALLKMRLNLDVTIRPHPDNLLYHE